MKHTFELTRAVLIIATAVLIAVCASNARAAASFNIVAIPDTQFEIESNPAMVQSQVDWITSNRDSRNIAFVSHQGDITQNGTLGEYTTAYDKLFQLDNAAGLPWGVCAGNHDLPNSTAGTLYETYFGPTNFAGRSWYGDTTSSHSSYQTFQAGGREYLVLDVQYRASSSVIAWAQGVIDTHEGMPTIVNTHDYIAVQTSSRSAYGNTLWNSLVDGNSQIFMVLCGHSHLGTEAWRQMSINDAGLPVYELHANYQDSNLGDGYLRLYEFDEDSSAIHATTYSPYNTSVPYITDPENQFDISMDFDARLGEVPEPSTLVLLAIGLLSMLAYAWKKRK